MESYHTILYGILLLTSAICSPFPKSEKEALVSGKTISEKPSESSATDDRIGLNVNRGHSHAFGPQGYSSSDANTFGLHAGILRPGNHYTPLYSQTGGQGSSYSSGPGAPTTWANGNSQLGNGYTGGQSGAGFHGGHGVAQTDSFTQHIAIPLDPFGTVLYSDFKDKSKKKNSQHTIKDSIPKGSRPEDNKDHIVYE